MQKSFFLVAVIGLILNPFAGNLSQAAEIIYCSNTITENCTKRGSGGSNPLVVEQLRQETYRMRALAAEQKVPSSSEIETVHQTPVSITPEVIPYPENFLTIGEQKEQEAKKNLQENIEKNIASKTEQLKQQGFETRFSDIEESKYKDDIILLEAMNVVAGQEEGIFNPTENINRVEATKIVTLINGYTPSENSSSSYSDIPEDHWSVPYLESAITAEIINPIDELNPEKPVTIEEAFFIYNWSTGIDMEILKDITPEYRNNPGSSFENIDSIAYEPITREEFTSLSVLVMETLWQTDESYSGPAEQLTEDKYSAYGSIPVNRSKFFPELFSPQE